MSVWALSVITCKELLHLKIKRWIDALCCYQSTYLNLACLTRRCWAASSAGCSDRSACCGVLHTGMRTIHRPQATHIHETSLRLSQIFAAKPSKLLSKILIQNKLGESRRGMIKTRHQRLPAQTSRISSAPGGFRPIQNNVIIGVLAGQETLIQIRLEGRTCCQSDSSSLRSASKHSLSSTLPVWHRSPHYTHTLM